ncbi:DUF2919 domain-containing protein [Thaumasiovibrio subtropicus]|uniref:DUF2919 domain-containing protein n=1 Tax=Thaumasiovibrio subtropicus TaxID=1891207 RepID=UPI00131AE684|nr:DUF2919 domain-containing protein [Thaumasiovibrio subtropicus]
MKHWMAHLDNHGWFVPPIWLWLGWVLLSRSWWLVVIAGVSREQGAALLELFYPKQMELYQQMALAAPVVVFMWLSGLRHKLPPWLLRVWQKGRGITLVVLVSDFVIQGYAIANAPLTATLPMLVTAVLTLWFALYLVRSWRVDMTFTMIPSDASRKEEGRGVNDN